MNSHGGGKVLFAATVVKTHIMQFHLPYLKLFQDKGWETSVAAKNDYDDPDDCRIPYCDHFFDIPIERDPFKLNNIRAYRQLKKIIDGGHYQIIHCHTPMGAALTRLASRKARRNGCKIIYTAHGFHFYKGAPLINWIIYYPVERSLAHFTDTLITINKEDHERARSFKAKKVEYVPGVGIDTEKFRPDLWERRKIRQELSVKDEEFILLTVGELVPRKNHIVVIQALGLLKAQGKLDDIKYLICGSGPSEERIRREAERQGVSDRVVFLGYRNDVDRIYRAADLFVLMSKQEGLPVAMMEALASGSPVICSSIRGNTDIVSDGENGVIIDGDHRTLAGTIDELRSSPESREQLSFAARRSAEKYDINAVMDKMRSVYNNTLSEGETIDENICGFSCL